MPRKPKHPCAYPNCPRLTDGKYCEVHAQTRNHEYEQFQRDKSVYKMYGNQWRKLRALYISEHPVCELCEKQGRLVPVEEVHHKIPIKQGGKNTWSNLMSLCQSCHTKIHMEMGDRQGGYMG